MIYLEISKPKKVMQYYAYVVKMKNKLNN